MKRIRTAATNDDTRLNKPSANKKTGDLGGEQFCLPSFFCCARRSDKEYAPRLYSTGRMVIWIYLLYFLLRL